jgi:hypothetical protein
MPGSIWHIKTTVKHSFKNEYLLIYSNLPNDNRWSSQIINKCRNAEVPGKSYSVIDVFIVSQSGIGIQALPSHAWRISEFSGKNKNHFWLNNFDSCHWQGRDGGESRPNVKTKTETLKS